MEKERIIEQVKALEQKVYELQEMTIVQSVNDTVLEWTDGGKSNETRYFEIQELAGMVQLLRINIELYFDEHHQ